MKNFVLIGAAGYIAPRHMQAIKDTGNNLLAIYDPFDSVGVIDRYFPDCFYFQDFERFDRYCYKAQRTGTPIDYVSIASPNYLHDPHCRWALRIGANAICEKPLVLSEKNLDAILAMEEETGKKVYGLYQLRYHPNFKAMQNVVKESGNEVNINYSTPRGCWYHFSWKGITGRSGGIETNIGCHLFDVCTALFGKYDDFRLREAEHGYSQGVLFFKNAIVSYRLSVTDQEPKRVFEINGIPFHFDSGFTDLHTEVYQNILNGDGIDIAQYRYSIRLCEHIRRAKENWKRKFR